MTLSDWVIELLDMVRRRLWLILQVIFLGCAASVFYTLSQAHQYTSTAVLQVEGAKVADELTPANMIAADARQLQVAEQRIMAYGNILEIAGDLGLLDDIAGLPDNEKVIALRESVRIAGVAAARAGSTEDGAISLVRISATWGDRESAQALAGEIAKRTIDLSREMRLERARETLSFFALREERLETQIAELENKIARFRKENGLPESGVDSTQEREIEALKAEILSVERQMIVLERQLGRTEDSGNLTRLEQRDRAETMERLDSLTEQRAYLDDSLKAVSFSGQRDPELQIQLMAFQRGLTALQEDLRNVSESRKSAEIAYQLESQGQSETLGFLEPATWPDYPSTPSRTKMAVMGAFASVLAALALAFLLDLRKSVLRSSAIMERDLGFTPIVTVPQARRTKGWLPWRRDVFARRLRA